MIMSISNCGKLELDGLTLVPLLACAKCPNLEGVDRDGAVL